MQIITTVLSSPPITTTLRAFEFPFMIDHPSIDNDHVTWLFQTSPDQNEKGPRSGLVLLNWKLSTPGDYLATCISDVVTGIGSMIRVRVTLMKTASSD